MPPTTCPAAPRTRTTTVGLLGAGPSGLDVAGRLARVAGAEVVAVHDADPAAAQDALPGARAYASGQELVATAAVDAVVLEARGRFDVEQARAAVLAGTPVLVLDPLRMRPSAWQRLLTAELVVGRRLVEVVSPRRFDPAYRALRTALHDGVAGTPRLVHVAGPSRELTADHVELAGGDVDVLRWLLGRELVSALPAATGLPLLLAEGGVHVAAEAALDLPTGFDLFGAVVGERDVLVVPRAEAGGPDGLDRQLAAWAAGVADRTGPTGPTAWDGYAAASSAEALRLAARGRGPAAAELGARPRTYPAPGADLPTRA